MFAVVTYTIFMTAEQILYVVVCEIGFTFFLMIPPLNSLRAALSLVSDPIEISQICCLQLIILLGGVSKVLVCTTSASKGVPQSPQNFFESGFSV